MINDNKEVKMKNITTHLSRQSIIKKHGKEIVSIIDKSHCSDWDKHMQEYQLWHCKEYRKKVPRGLEKLVYLGWFQHLFDWDNQGEWQPDIEGGFYGNWNEVPYEGIKEINIYGNVLTLSKKSYTWLNLLIAIDYLMFKGQRYLDLGITDIHREGDTLFVSWCT